MSDRQVFGGAVEPLVRGRAADTILRLPDAGSGAFPTPGTRRVEVRLRRAPPDSVDTPGDLAATLHRTDRTADWETPTPGRRRGLVCRTGTAKTAATCARRIAARVEGLGS